MHQNYPSSVHFSLMYRTKSVKASSEILPRQHFMMVWCDYTVFKWWESLDWNWISVSVMMLYPHFGWGWGGYFCIFFSNNSFYYSLLKNLECLQKIHNKFYLERRERRETFKHSAEEFPGLCQQKSVKIKQQFDVNLHPLLLCLWYLYLMWGVSEAYSVSE